jgi:hypothetical protein
VAGHWGARHIGGHGRREGAHPKHASHFRDAGCVQVQRLVEGRRALSSHNGALRAGYTRG